MEFHIVIPVLISFAISAVLGPVIIPFLRKLKMGQTERTEGVQSHLKKAGTPTMGGVIFLISTIITSLYFYFLPAAVYRCVSDHAYSILGWALSESWLAGCTGAVLCSDRNGKWRKLY